MTLHQGFCSLSTVSPSPPLQAYTLSFPWPCLPPGQEPIVSFPVTTLSERAPALFFPPPPSALFPLSPGFCPHYRRETVPAKIFVSFHCKFHGSL